MTNFVVDRIKLTEAVCLIIDSCNPRDLGAVKLHKVLYYSDMLHYLESGAPITGSRYRKRPFGPTCDHLLGVLAELEAMGDLRIEEADHFGYKKKEFRLLRKRNYTNLSDREIALLGEMLQFVCYQNTARSISDFSHDIVWDMVDFGQDIPYHSVLNWLPSEVSVEALEEASAIRHSIEGTKPVRAVDLEGCVPTPLRARLARHAGQAAVS